MIDKEYIKEIISRITKKKADGNIVPATASMQEIAVNRTLNSVSFKCL